MLLKEISLINFRSFVSSHFNIHEHLTIIFGENSVGKTNLLEAIFVAMKGKGFREKNEEELISINKPFTEIKAILEENNIITSLRIYIEKKDVLQKAFFKDKSKKRLFDYISDTLPTVIFSPSLIYVIDGDLSDRREYIDSILCLCDVKYKQKLHNYEVSLRKRNKILEKHSFSKNIRSELSFWDHYLIEEASYIVAKRREFVDFLNNYQKIDHLSFKIEYIIQEISAKTLEDTFERQLLIRKTLVGPQRDIFTIYLASDKEYRNVHMYGSRSQQRLALLWIILQEIKLYEKTLGKKPLVLLDDIFSELDENHKHLIFALIKNYQTIVTTTEHTIEEIADIPMSVIPLKNLIQ